MVKVDVESLFSRIRIRIDGIIHLSLPQSENISVQSWLNPQRSYYAIEYSLSETTVLCEYDNRELWSTILKKLEENKII